MKKLSLLFFAQLAVVLFLNPTVPTKAGVVYYVQPTESCTNNHSSCPPNKTCHEMDYYANSSDLYFASDHINVTLYFLCGVHYFTRDLAICNLNSFLMIGIAGKQDVLVMMPKPGEDHSTHIFGGLTNR